MTVAARDAGWEFVRPAFDTAGVGMVGFRDLAGVGMDLRVAAIPAVTVVLSFGADLVLDRADDTRIFSGFVAGPDAGAMAVRCPQAAGVEVRLPLVCAAGFAAADLVHGPVALTDLWGRRADRLRDQLATCGWQRRFELARDALVEPAPVVPPGEVMYAWRRMVSSRGRVRISELAHECGWSRKRLWRSFERATGLTPKRAAMLVRFRHAVEGLVDGRSAADVAAGSGYTDQSHLCRDVASFTGTTPGAIPAALEPVAAGRYGAWGTFFQD